MTRDPANSENRFRQAAKELVEVVFTDDMEYYDALPDTVERELGTPLAALVPLADETDSVERLVAAAQLVEEIAADMSAVLPPDLFELIEAMRTARLELDPMKG